MRLLDRYLLRELLIPFGYCLSGFFVFWLSFDLLSEMDALQRSRLGTREVAEYYLWRTPELLGVVVPIAFLLALLYALTHHARHHELTAIRAAGVSLGRLAAPYLGVGLGLSGLVFWLNEWWVPEGASRAQAVLERHVGRASSDARNRWETKVGFTNTRENRKWFMTAFNLVTFEMLGPHLEWIMPDGTRRVLAAERAEWTGEGWLFHQVEERVYPPERGADPGPPLRLERVPLSQLTERPEEILSEIKVNKISHFKEARQARFSIREILRYKRLHTDRSEKAQMMDTALQARLAAPWTCLVVVLIALPFGARSGRRNVFVGVASALALGFSYFLLQEVALAVGTRGTIPGWVAGWMPNLVFALTGLGLSWRLR